MTLSVLYSDGRPFDVEQPGREHASDDDALLSFLALQMMTAPSGGYLVQSTDARGVVEAQIGIVVAAPGHDVGERGEQYAWTGPPFEGWQTSHKLRQARERLVLSVRQHAERAEFEATGDLPGQFAASPPMPPHPDRLADALREREQRADWAEPYSSARRELMGDLADGYRALPARPPMGGAHAAGAHEAHLGEHYENVASGDAATLDERAIAATLALGQRVLQGTEVARESTDETAAALDRIATALETLVGFAENAPTRRRSWWRRAWVAAGEMTGNR